MNRINDWNNRFSYKSFATGSEQALTEQKENKKMTIKKQSETQKREMTGKQPDRKMIENPEIKA